MPITPRLRATACALYALLLLAVSTSGCLLSRPAPVRNTYLLELSPGQAGAETSLPGVLLVGGFEVAQPFAAKEMVYRFDEYRYDSDFYNEFFVAPRDMIGQRVLEWLQGARPYETVAPLAGTRAPGGHVLQGLVNEMYADVRDAAHPAAVLSMQFYVTRERRRSGEVLFAQQLSQRSPMRDASAAAYAAALSEALAAILAEFDKRLRAADLPAPHEPGERSDAPERAPPTR